MKRLFSFPLALAVLFVLILSGCAANDISEGASDTGLVTQSDTGTIKPQKEEIKVPSITNVYKQSVPVMRFIGKKYEAAADWGEWFAHDWFGAIERAASGEETVHQLYEDGDAYIAMKLLDSEYNVKEYWIGMFVAPDTEPPEDFLFMDYPAQNLGVCWIYGRDLGEILGFSGQAEGKLIQAGMEIVYEEGGLFWCFERYGCPRYTTPDEQGNITLDYCYIVK